MMILRENEKKKEEIKKRKEKKRREKRGEEKVFGKKIFEMQEKLFAYRNDKLRYDRGKKGDFHFRLVNWPGTKNKGFFVATFY